MRPDSTPNLSSAIVFGSPGPLPPSQQRRDPPGMDERGDVARMAPAALPRPGGDVRVLGIALLERGPQGRGVLSCPPAQGWICGGLGARLAGTAVQGGICSSGPGTASPPLAGAALEERSTLHLSVRMCWHPKSLQRGSSSWSSTIPPRVVLSPRSGGSISALWLLAAFPVPSNCF